MKILVACLFAGIFVAACDYSFAQTKKAVIQGKISVENHATADLASVLLLSAVDSAVLKSTACDNTGSFKFTAIEPGNYLVLATKIGYTQLISGPYNVTGAGAINISVTLTRAYPVLKEVTVTTQKPYIEVKSDRVILNVQGSAIAQGNSAFDILRQAPGVRVTGNGNVSLIGHQNALIMIDGKPTTLTGEDLNQLMQAMQSSSIQQIELITSPSAKYEAAGAGIINIISKKGTNIGTNGNLSAGAGFGNYYKANVGFAFNNRTDKINVFGNYSFTPDKTFHAFNADRLINYQGTVADFNTNYFASQERYSHNFKAGADYYLSTKQTLGLSIYGTIINSDFDKRNNLKIANNGVPDSSINSTSVLKRVISNITYDVNYNGTLDKSGKTLSADVLYNNSDRQSTEHITNNFYTTSGSIYRQPLLQQNLSPSTIHNWIAKVDFVDPISKNSKIEAGLKYSYIKSNNNLIFGPFANGQYQSDPNFSNTFVFTENINSGYVNYSNNTGKLNIITGLRVEQTNSTGNSITLMHIANKSYFDFFPNVHLTYQYNDKNEFSLSFTRGNERPSYAVINPFLYYADLYDYKAGNPNLLPQYSNFVELSHTYNKTIITTIYAHITTGFYGFNDFMQNDATKANIATNNNFGTYSSYGIRFSDPVQFTNWWLANLVVDAAYQRFKAYPAYGNLNKGTQDIEPGIFQKFTINNTITFELTGKYYSPEFFGIDQFKGYSEVDAAISKQLFNKKASLKLGINDLFNSYVDRGYSTYQNLNYKVIDKSETRIFRLNFTYRFGKSTVKSITHKTANEDEIKRAAVPVN
jgi:iron complex outermembrane receptor protein